MTTTTSPPLSGRAAVSTPQPLATTAGISILQNGGNAADAAITISAMLSVTEPCSNGLGGDFIALHHTPTEHLPIAILGNGPSPQALTKSLLYPEHIKFNSPHTITVPGAVSGWIDTYANFSSGKFTLAQLLHPAIIAVEDGFQVKYHTSGWWKEQVDLLRVGMNGEELLVEGFRAPKVGEWMRNPGLGAVLREIGKHGFDGFYKGWVGQRIVDVVQELGGVLCKEDLERMICEFEKPLIETYKGVEVMEVGNPTQGALALGMLKVFEDVEKGKRDIRGLPEVDVLHRMIDSVRLGFAAGRGVIGHGEKGRDGVKRFLETGSVEELRRRLRKDRKCELDGLKKGIWGKMGGTVQFCVVDKDGTMVSAVQSNYLGFGTGHVPKGCGFSLNNRGLGFDEYGVNGVGGDRKPYHTIMPGMMRMGETMVAFGVMGTFMQPQGHVQVVAGLVDGLDVTQVVNMPRFRVTGEFSAKEPGMDEDVVFLEHGFDNIVCDELRKKGHEVKIANMEVFGRSHICMRTFDGFCTAAADNRADGIAWVI